MKRILLSGFAAVAIAAPASATHYLQAEPRSFPLAGANQLKIEFPVGDFTVEGDDGDDLRVFVRVKCKSGNSRDCQEEARRIRIDHRVSGSTFTLEFEGVRKSVNSRGVEVEVRVLAPRTLGVRLDMGVGDLDVREMTGDVSVELGVGDVRIDVDERDYKSAEIQAGVGDATIRSSRGAVREKGFIGHSAHWYEGTGRSTIEASVGVGEGKVTLR